MVIKTNCYIMIYFMNQFHEMIFKINFHIPENIVYMIIKEILFSIIKIFIFSLTLKNI
jgi:hypothetical protein